MKIELLQYLSRFNILGYTIHTLKSILMGENDKYRVDYIDSGITHIEDKENSEIKILKCVAQYYSLPDGTRVQEKENRFAVCSEAKSKISCYEGTNCIECHIRALEKLKNNELKKINFLSNIKKRILNFL